jgi:hypothetical protein
MSQRKHMHDIEDAKMSWRCTKQMLKLKKKKEITLKGKNIG